MRRSVRPLLLLTVVAALAVVSIQPALGSQAGKKLSTTKLEQSLLTAGEASAVAGFAGALTPMSDYTGCTSRRAYTSCQHEWATSGPELYPRHVGAWSFTTRKAALAWMRSQRATAPSLGWTVSSASPTELVFIVDREGAGSVDLASITRLVGTTAVNAQCMRAATASDFGAVTTCTSALTTAQAKRFR